MHYTREQRLNIGRQIYNGELSKYDAAEKYNICVQTARNYMRLYRDENNLPPKKRERSSKYAKYGMANYAEQADLNDLENLTKEELIAELIKARIREARLKKGYEVKGDGTVIQYDSKNTK